MKTKRLIAWMCGVPLVLLMLLFLLALGVSYTPAGAVLMCLPLGWWHFLQRNLPQMTCNRNLIVTGTICSVLLVVAGNLLLGVLFRQVQQSVRPDQPARPWRWRWTVGLYAAVWLLFAIAIGTTGIFRHTTWLMDYPQPWYQERLNSYSEIRMLDMNLQELLLENNQDIQATRKGFLGERSYRRRHMLLADEFDVIFFADKSNKVAAYVIIPRNPQLVAKGEFGASIPGNNDLVRPVSELQRTLADLDAAYPQGR
jgi:hypothetical protein